MMNNKKSENLKSAHKRNPKWGFQKGQKGYWTGKKRVYKNPEERNRKISEAMRGIKAWQWKGGNASYNAKHQWIKKWYGFPDVCEHCNKSGLKGYEINWANKSGKYLRDRNDWLRLCGKCHRKHDKHKYNESWKNKISKTLKETWKRIKLNN